MGGGVGEVQDASGQEAEVQGAGGGQGQREDQSGSDFGGSVLGARLPEIHRDYDAQVLTATREISEYFEKAAKAAGDARMAANWVTGDLLGALKGREITESPVSPEQLGELVAFIAKGEISGKMAKDIFAKMFETGESAASSG